MTGIPVKDVNSLMNFVGGRNLSKTGSAKQSGGFNDVMNMAKNSQGSQNSAVSGSQEMKQSSANALKSRTDTVKPERTQQAEKTAAGQDDPSKAVEEAGKEIVKEIAEEMGVTEEEVVKAMEELGLSMFSLFDPSSLTALILQLSGEGDATALLTDENLFASLQDLLKMAEDAKAGLMQEMNLTPEELKSLLEKMQAMGAKGEGVVNAAGEQEEAAPVTVEVKAGDETVKLAADENGNAIKTVEVVPTNAKENVSDENSGNRKNEGEGQTDLQGGNPLINSQTVNEPQTAEVPFEQMTSMLDGQTRDIMDQIMDYMKIQLKPGMDQLEMQLHPESLGTVHIQLISRGGEVTAHFQVQDEAVRAAIESQISTLQDNLKEQGVKVDAVQVTVESHGFESNLWQGQGREENASSSQSGRKTPRRINLNELGGFQEEDASEEELLTAKMMAVNGNTVDYTA